MSSLWSEWGPSEIFAFCLAACLAAAVLLALRRQKAVELMAALAFLPVPVVALFSRQFDLVGWHGFMHAAPIYRMLEGGPVPPEEPLFAGGSLRYPWVEHWLVALVSRVTGANVHLLTLGLEVCAYAALLGAGYWLATAVSRDRAAVALAVLFTGFGITVFHVGLLLEPFQRAVPGLWLETRVVPLDKFANLSAMPLGYASMALSAAAGVRLALRQGNPRRLSLVVAGCTLLAALVHPLSWLCILPFQGVTGLVLLLARRKEDYRRAAWLAAAVGVPCLLALPYLRSVGVSESSDGWTGLTRPAELGWAKVGDALVYLGPWLLLTYLCRASLVREWKEGNRALRIVLLAVPTMVAAYLLLRFPGRNEYKFLLCLVPAAAAVMGACLNELLARHVALGALLLFALLTPGARALGYRPWFEVTRACRTDGPYLRAVEPAADMLYQWIARETPRDAVFVSDDLDVPPLGRRSLYIVVDQPWRGRNGWGLEAYKLLQWHVRRTDSEMSQREARAQQVLAPSWESPADELIAQLEADVQHRPLYVLAQNVDTQAKLDQTPGFRRRFGSPLGAIYSVDGARVAGSGASEPERPAR